MNSNSSIDNKLLLNYFPDDQSKYNDYVIYYEENEKTTLEFRKKLNSFKIKLINEGFKIKILEDKNGKKKSNYLLLHCSPERLMIEAERLELDVPLKNVRKLVGFINKQKIIYSKSSLRSIYLTRAKWL